MATVDRISDEARLRPRVAILAGLGALLLFGSMILQSAGPQAKVSEVTVQLLVANRRAGLEIVGAVVNGLGLLALAGTLAFLFTAVKARKPEASKGTLMTLPVGGVLAAAGGIGYGVIITTKAHQFATHGLQTYPQANTLLRSGPVAALQYAGLIGSLVLAVGFVLVALNAMRVGLLTRLVGYFGIAAAAASLLLIGSPFVLFIEVFWLLATAYLLSGRWPNGDPPAWKAGEAVPWPSSAELREQRAAAGGGRGRQARARPEPQPEPVAAAPAPRSTGAKRKRKRRK